MPELADGLVEALESEPARDPNRRRAYTHEEAVALAHMWCEASGAPPTKREWNPAQQSKTIRLLLARIERLQDSIERYREGQYPSEVTVRKLFGSWNGFLHSCGWEPRDATRPRIQSANGKPSTPSRDQQLRGAGTHLSEKRRRQLIEREANEPIGQGVLAARLRAVVMAQQENDPAWLAGELESLAATALAWADRLLSVSDERQAA